MSSSRPTVRSASGCWRSRLRWHSGHGVTRQSAVGVDRVAQVAAGLLERRLLVHRDDREAAALVRAGVLDDRAAERLDDLRAGRCRAGARRRSRGGRWGARCSSRRTGRRCRSVSGRLTRERSSSRPISSTSSHRKFLLVEALLVAAAPRPASVSLTCSRYSALASRRSWHSVCAPWQVEQMFIIRSAPVDLLGEREGARVERVGELLVVLGDDAGAAAARAVELDELDVEQRRDLAPSSRAARG